jgi:hypothetical protein
MLITQRPRSGPSYRVTSLNLTTLFQTHEALPLCGTRNPLPHSTQTLVLKRATQRKPTEPHATQTSATQAEETQCYYEIKRVPKVPSLRRQLASHALARMRGTGSKEVSLFAYPRRQDASHHRAETLSGYHPPSPVGRHMPARDHSTNPEARYNRQPTQPLGQTPHCTAATLSTSALHHAGTH